MEIILKRTFDSRIDRTLNRVLQIFGEGCDMRIVGARIGGKLLPVQFTTLPGTVERMLQVRSFTNGMIQNMESVFDGHKLQWFGAGRPNVSAKMVAGDSVSGNPVPLRMHHHEKLGQGG